MGRRRDSNGVETTVELVALMPWWVGVLLAVVGHVLFRHFASQPLIVDGARPTASLTPMVWRSISMVLQYVAPLACLAGAAVSAWRRRERRHLADGVVRGSTAEAINGMSWRQFEQLVGEAFRRQGYSVAETGGGGADGGIDLVLRRNGEKHLVQCKQWRAYKVGVEVVRELYGVMAAQGAAGGFVVTSGRFTDEARRFAEGRNVRLLDGPHLERLLRSASGPTPAPSPVTKGGDATPRDTSVSGPSPSRAEAPAPASDSAGTAPACPRCARPMLRRTAKRGDSAGRGFWGCSDYPRCKGTVDIRA